MERCESGAQTIWLSDAARFGPTLAFGFVYLAVGIAAHAIKPIIVARARLCQWFSRCRPTRGYFKKL